MKLKLGFCLLIVFNYMCESVSVSLQQVIRESVEKGLKSLTQLKRQLPEDLDEEAMEVISMDKDYSTRDEVPDSVPNPARRAAVVEEKPNTNDEDRQRSTCSCEIHKRVTKPPETSRNLLNFYIYDDSDKSVVAKTHDPTATTTVQSARTKHINHKDGHLNETHFELQELEFQIDAAMRSVCPHFKDIPELDIDGMADVWQLAYYKGDVELSCFKIFVKKTTPQGRKRNNVKYTSFNDTIKWQQCYLELGPTGKRDEHRKHFLQGSKNDKGVLENIVLAHSSTKDSKTITLLDQTPDQWLVVKNLLLMRDCASGNVVVFTRVPSKHDKRDLVEAIIKFGETEVNDIKPCKTHEEDNASRVKKHYAVKNMEYYMLS